VTKTLTVYQGSTWPEYGLTKGGSIVRVIPEFWQPDVYGGYAVGSEFSPDGRYLLVSWGARVGLLLYDTSTWQPVTDPHLFPQHLKEYIHSADWNLGLAVTETGEALVWDQQAHRVLSLLPGLGDLEPAPNIRDRQGRQVYTSPSGKIQSAAFSPDRMRVAVLGSPDRKARLNVWDIQAGKKLRDYWPLYGRSDGIGNPLWWDDGHWLLARYGSSIELWDAQTGRLKGTLDIADGCDAREDPVASGSRLLQRCFAGKDHAAKVLEWSVDGVTSQLGSAATLAGGPDEPGSK
jgi:WD40 repeat protein